MTWLDVVISFLLVLLLADCFLLCVVVLMQRSKQEGLGSAFASGFTEQLMGAQTSQVLVKATVVFAAVFFVLSISLARLYTYRVSLSPHHAPVSSVSKLLTDDAAATPSTNAALSTTTLTNALNIPTTVSLTNGVPDASSLHHGAVKLNVTNAPTTVPPQPAAK